MINPKTGQRELAYTVKIDEITPIAGADRVEAAHISGWTVMVRKGEFQVGDYGIYFEIDSKVPSKSPFEFLESKNYKIKIQKYFKGTFYSEGLLLPLNSFEESYPKVIKEIKTKAAAGENIEHIFLTKELGVTYAEAQDNIRKAPIIDKYKSMAQRRPDIFKRPSVRKIMKYSIGRKIMFAFFGKKKQDNNKFPKQFPYIHRTDEERVENIPWILEDKQPWIKTLKIDGTSSTYILEKKKFKKNKFYVCSRSVVIHNEKQKTFHDDNVYWINAKQYHIREFLEEQLRKHPKWKYCAIQGESCGEGIQGNPHELTGIKFYGFNFIDSESGRWNSIESEALCSPYKIPWVPILSMNYILPDTMEEFKLSADGKCNLPNSSGLREGFVYRSYDGKKSFKNVSREYLLSRK